MAMIFGGSEVKFEAGVAEMQNLFAVDWIPTFGIKYTVRKADLYVGQRRVDGIGYTLQFMAFRDDFEPFRLARKLNRMRIRSEVPGL